MEMFTDITDYEERWAPGRLEINLGAVRENYRILKLKLAKGCEIAPAVKANAYGLGMVEVAGALREEGAHNFFVANLHEGLVLRRAYGDVGIFILNGFYSSDARAYVDFRLTPVIGSFMELKAYAALSGEVDRALSAFLHFNTRMNRLGFGSVETRELLGNLDMLSGIDVQGVMSHLACADEPEHDMNRVQLEIFTEISDRIAQKFPQAKRSLANSSGIFLGEDYHFDMVRPGMALYGLNPVPHQGNIMRRVVSLTAPVMRTRIVYQGAHVGYGATHRFEKESPLATVSAGYADGVFWALGNRGALYWNGIRCPIRGRVSMDLTTVDLSDVPPQERPKPGDEMELLGPHQSPDDLARDAGTIGYEVLTALGARYQRAYRR